MIKKLLLLLLLVSCDNRNPVDAIASVDDSDQRLGQYAINMMYTARVGKKLSDAKKLILARSIVRATNEIFTDDSHKRAFVAALAIESGFQKFAQSPTGPKGYAQLARATFREALGFCGIVDVHDDDVWETDLNLISGACYFRKMLEIHGNDTYQALVAYNQGANSQDSKSYSENGSLNGIEPLKYIARFVYLKSKTNDQKMPNIPAFQNGMRPSSSLPLLSSFPRRL